MVTPQVPQVPAQVLAWVAAAVAALRPIDEREARSRQRILTELARLPRPFDEHADRVHVTASAVVWGRRGTLLHRHKRMGIWMQPGGHLEPGECPSDAALRETAEETGLTVSHPEGRPRLLHVDVHPAFRGHTHLDLRYELRAGEEDPCPPPGESPDVRWFSWQDALAVADNALRGALQRARPAVGRDRGAPAL
jgi:8-oxo-dGTP pyrophosphatase MutT (NUDIX family)